MSLILSYLFDLSVRFALKITHLYVILPYEIVLLHFKVRSNLHSAA